MADKPLILIVDDEKDLADNISEIIKSSGLYNIATAYSTKTAQEVLKKNQPLLGIGKNRVRLIILDIKMPGVDGLKLLSEIRAEYLGIGVIILTAFEDREKWEKARQGLVSAYFKKPIKEQELLSAIERFFDGKEDWMIEQTKWELLAREAEEKNQ